MVKVLGGVLQYCGISQHLHVPDGVHGDHDHVATSILGAQTHNNTYSYLPGYRHTTWPFHNVCDALTGTYTFSALSVARIPSIKTHKHTSKLP